MSTKTNIYFASDFHLGAPNHSESLEREKKIVSWLNKIEQDAKAIYLVGDIFDVWYEWKHAIPKGHVRLLGKLAEICDSGTPVHFFTGNHDLWTFGYLEKEIGLQVHRHPIQVEHQGKKLYIGHGDGLGPGDRSYKFLKKIFTNRLCQWLFSRIHPNTSFSLANYFSSTSRITKKDSDEQFKGEDQEWLVQYSKEILNAEHFDYLIFGHRHLPLEIELNSKSEYINLGDWISHFTYGIFDGKQFKLKKWEVIDD